MQKIFYQDLRSQNILEFDMHLHMIIGRFGFIVGNTPESTLLQFKLSCFITL